MASDTPVHVLVADDEVLVAWALRSILEEAGYQIGRASCRERV